MTFVGGTIAAALLGVALILWAAVALSGGPGRRS